MRYLVILVYLIINLWLIGATEDKHDEKPPEPICFSCEKLNRHGPPCAKNRTDCDRCFDGYTDDVHAFCYCHLLEEQTCLRYKVALGGVGFFFPGILLWLFRKRVAEVFWNSMPSPNELIVSSHTRVYIKERETTV